ncbi:MAG: septum formation protein Maf [Clostridia bacterium]|nr:septum formation protein Maf [Clostridia bacterium]
MKKLILASASPRRRQILSDGGFSFDVLTSDKEEHISAKTSPEKFAVRNALIKAEDVYQKTDGTPVVLGADTVVQIDGVILEKPKDEADAERMLRLLSGRTHEVITGYAIITKGMHESGYAVSKVTFNELSEEQISNYVKSGLCMDKAGAYGIQDGYGLIKCFDGDYDNVVGLPLEQIKSTIEEFLK